MVVLGFPGNLCGTLIVISGLFCKKQSKATSNERNNCLWPFLSSTMRPIEKNVISAALAAKLKRAE